MACRLRGAEEAVLEAGGVAIRFVGLYHAHRSATAVLCSAALMLSSLQYHCISAALMLLSLHYHCISAALMVPSLQYHCISAASVLHSCGHHCINAASMLWETGSGLGQVLNKPAHCLLVGDLVLTRSVQLCVCASLDQVLIRCIQPHSSVTRLGSTAPTTPYNIFCNAEPSSCLC